MLDRYAKILEAVTAIGEPVAVGSLAKLTGLPRPTCYRLVTALEKCGFLEAPENDGRYTIGMRLVRIALLGKPDGHVQRAISSVMEHMVVQVGETGFFSRFRGGRVDLIHVETPQDPNLAFIYPGMGERPAHACSSAKVIAAYAPEDIRDDLIGAMPTEYTDRTRVRREDILADLEETKGQGYALCDGEIDEGVVSVAVPIMVDRLGAVFSLGVVGPSKRIHGRPVGALVPILKDTAVRASAAIQHCSLLEAEQLHQ
ncbi:IclR family transcriptional regulator [Pelagibius sp. Alg239-R121]|uniref:IclR family transcriptional regulator n=1 Tax=Pelagibius sp. Alg239-R121 TaxID=2993448 RepID=UPI0024A6464D|nr:IclR family transcriptional regulator [Pelagibius sp. Alg239-R121]